MCSPAATSGIEPSREPPPPTPIAIAKWFANVWFKQALRQKGRKSAVSLDRRAAWDPREIRMKSR
jgi:hypothetical protein